MIKICDGLNFPTSLCFDRAGHIYIAESGLPFDGAPPGGRVLKVEDNGVSCLVDNLRPPLNGLRHHNDDLLIAEGGEPGRLSRYNLGSKTHQIILDGLPGGGNYHTNILIQGPDKKLYFGQGAATNSGIVGPDANMLAWLKRLPHPYDIPGFDIILSGENGRAMNPETGGEIVTGPFMTFGEAGTKGQTIKGQLPCTAAIMRCNPDGSELELFAWGLRNPFGLEFLKDGRLLAVDLGMNDRGSRPVGNGPDSIFHVESGKYYGWPDFIIGRSVTDAQFQSNRTESPALKPLLTNHSTFGDLTQPLIDFVPHAAPTRFAVHPESGDLYVAMFGDKRPFTGIEGPRAGRHLLRINLEMQEQTIIADLPLHRPIDLAFHPQTHQLYVLDFGQYEMGGDGSFSAQRETGAIWRV